MLLEGVLTFFLVFVFFATAVDVKGAFNKIAGLRSASPSPWTFSSAIPFTGAAAKSRPRLRPRPGHPQSLENHGVYWVGPLLGGVLAGVIYDRIFLLDQPPL